MRRALSSEGSWMQGACIQQAADVSAKHAAELAQDHQGRIADSTLDLADVGSIDVRVKSQLLL